MRSERKLFQSPLNYTGGKYKLLPQLLPFFPEKINTFVDLFCGGCNVGINVDANNHIYNDINSKICNLYKILSNSNPNDFISLIYKIISDYGLSLSSQNGYAYYGCKSTEGLSSYNKNKYIALRSDFNNCRNHDMRYYAMLYVLVVYGFNNQIRFNIKDEFNLPVGKRDFNLKMQNKLLTFMKIIKVQDATFTNLDFRYFDFNSLEADDFVYVDPPYLITCATYNERNGWNAEYENELLDTLNYLNNRGIRFALSNVLESKKKKNEILGEWISKYNYRVIDLNFNYKNANYHRHDKKSTTKEVLILNY